MLIYVCVCISGGVRERKTHRKEEGFIVCDSFLVTISVLGLYRVRVFFVFIFYS